MKKRIFSAIAALILAACAGFTAIASSAAALIEASDEYDLSHPGSESNVTLGAESVIESYLSSLGEKLCEAERAFVTRFCKLNITYNASVPNNRVTVSYEAGKIILTAEPYSYESQSGTVSFLPKYAVIGSERVLLDENGRTELLWSEPGTFACELIYEAERELSADDVNACLNLYSDTAKYCRELKDFSENERLYKEYKVARRIYDEAYEEYSAYLVKLQQYEAARAAYAKYEADFAEYEEKYSHYIEYLARLEAYEKELSAYRKYVDNKNLVLLQLEAFELVKDAKVSGRSLYGAVMGGTVDEVLNNRSVITGILQVDEQVVLRAGAATERVRALMINYYKLETEEERYNYYVVNYNNIKESFTELTVTLERLYRYPRVRGTLIAEGKNEKYIILVAQLINITSAITDGAVPNYEGKSLLNESSLIDGRTVKSVMSDAFYSDGECAAPITSGYPKPVTEPKPIDVIEEPTAPTEPKLPIKPDEVEEPVPPEKEIGEPAVPVASDSVKVIYGKLTETEREALIGSQSIPDKRTLLASPFSIKLAASCEAAYGEEKITVSFLGESGERLYTLTVGKGSTVIYEGELPEKPDDELGSYRFAGWRDSNGNRVSLASVESSVNLYPQFERKPTYYTVKWIIDGQIYEEHLISDTVPTPPAVPSKPDTSDFIYEFEGWDKPIAPLCCNVTYEAQFKKIPLVSHSGGSAAITDDGKTVTVNAYTNYDGRLNLSLLLPRISGERALSVKAPWGSVYFSFASVIEMNRLGVQTLFAEVYQNGVAECGFSVSLFDTAGTIVGENVKAEARVPYGIGSIEQAKLFCLADGERKYSEFGIAGNTVSVNVLCSRTYSLLLEYKISVTESNGATVSIGKTVARPGDSVSFGACTGEDRFISEIIITDSSGKRIIPEDDGSFRMPYSNVRIAVRTAEKRYKVSFVCDGVTVTEYEALHGESVTPPANPVKESDGVFSYEFIGWLPEISNASGDRAYTAYFKRTLLPIEPKEEGLVVTESVMRLIVLAAVGGAILVLAVIPASVISVVLSKKIKKLRKKTQNKAE